MSIVRTAPLSTQEQRLGAEKTNVGAAWFCTWGILLSLNLGISIYSNFPFGKNVNEVIKPLLTTAALIGGCAFLWTDYKNQKGAFTPKLLFLLPVFALTSALSLWWGMAKLELVSALLLWGAAVFTVEGKDRFLLWLRPAFLALFLMGDLPDDLKQHICVPLQYASCTLAVLLTKLFIPIAQSAHQFIVDGHKYDVAAGCSGLNMWASFLFAFAIWQVFIRYRPIAYLVAFAVDPMLTLGLNSIRLFITAMVAHFYSQETAIAIHSNLEFLLVPPGLLALWYVGGKFRAK